MFFRRLIQFNRPPAGATGPLVASDVGPSLTNVFANSASPERWYERAKRYTRTDVEVARLDGNKSWLGLRRVYVSSFNETIGMFGRGWATSYDYRVDVDRSTICKIYLWNSRRIRVLLEPLLGCDDIKRSLASQVSDSALLDKSLREILETDDLAERVLPDNGPSYVGADYQVARMRYIATGLELTIGSLKYAFNSHGKLQQIRSQGRIIQLNYDGNQRLAAIRDGDKAQELSYSTTGRVSIVRFSDGTQYEYGYDEQDNLTQVTAAGSAIVAYAYDGNNRLIGATYATEKDKETDIVYSADGVRTSVKKDGKEFRWKFRDDANGMPTVEQLIFSDGAVEEERKYEFDYQERRLTLTSNRDLTSYVLTQCLCLPLVVEGPEGRVVYRYDVFGRVISATLPSGEVELSSDLLT